MGLDANYPAVRINDPVSTVAVWNGAHTIIGSLGPDDHYHSAAANVTCTIQRWNGRWYKLLNSSAWDIPSASAYVSAARTHLMSGGPDGYLLGPCENNTDQPGRSLLWLRLVMSAAALALIRRLLGTGRRRLGRKAAPSPGGTDIPGLE